MRLMELSLLSALVLGGCAAASEDADSWRRLGEGALDADAAVGAAEIAEPAGPSTRVAGPGAVGEVVINEVAAAGDPVDWFELYNIDGVPVDLSSWTFTDDLTAVAPGPGTFAAGTVLEPGDFLRVEVSNEASGFKLGKAESLVLFDGRGVPVDAVDWQEGESPAGQSFAREPDGIGGFRTVEVPTPGGPNTF